MVKWHSRLQKRLQPDLQLELTGDPVEPLKMQIIS